VSDFSSPPEEVAARRVVVISARVHPGETNASWMVHGLLEAVTAPTAEAAALRRAVMLRIVPMLNPDGVVLGNYRCGVAGVDLNRQWAEPSEALMPTVHHLKRVLRSHASNDQLLLFCDLHGHSRKHNVFAYGCEGSAKSGTRWTCRVFPTLLAEGCELFSLPGCSYKVLRSKENTSRVVVWRTFGLVHSYTLEASFCGADFGTAAGVHFGTRELRQMGAAFVPALLALTDPAQTRVNAILAALDPEAAAPTNPTAGPAPPASDIDLPATAEPAAGAGGRGRRSKPPQHGKPKAGATLGGRSLGTRSRDRSVAAAASLSPATPRRIA